MRSRRFFVGDVHNSTNYGKFRIVSYTNTDNIGIEFIDTGFTTTVNSSRISKGNIKDPYFKSVCGVGYLGEYSIPCKIGTTKQREYVLWYNMVSNCYDDNKMSWHPHYNGVKVCDRWLCYANFLEDLPLIEGYENWKNNPNTKQCLARTLKYEDNKVYSPHTCIFSNMSHNSSVVGARHGGKK